MKKAEIKDRVSKVDERIVALVKRYPLVFGTVVFVSFVLGFIVSKFS